MRPSEMQFSRQGGLFYTSPDEVGAPTPGSAIRDAYRTDVDHCERWQVVDEGPWRHHVCADAGPIPDQGWKIHVSALPDDAQPTLDAVAGEIARRGIPFKHLRDEDRLRASLAKYGDRVQCGKFITVYPRDGQEAVALMTRLSRILGPREAPVVLGDARWGRSPVYFRYGAHRLVLMDDPEHGQVPALRDPTGALVPDTRAASFTCPDWVEVPGPMREHIARRGAPDTTAEDWYPYTVESVMHFSNAGGVYLASCADGDDPVVFKEARPNVGLDDDGRWAVDRLRHEAQVIEVLASVEAVVRLKETRTIGGHLFLIEEYIDGPTLSTWIAQNYPFSMSGPDTAPGGVAAQDYVRRATGICRALRRAVEQVHAAGYALIDLQPMNVLIEADDKPRLIDLEAARPLNDRSPITIGTPGFVGPEDLIAEQQDWFAYNRIVAHIFYPLVPLNAISDHLLDVQIGQARRLLSDDVAFEELLMEDPPRHHDILPMVCAGQPDDVGELRRRLVAGLEDVTEPGPHGPTVPGDIVSFSGLGRINIESGTAGVLLTEELKEGFARLNLDRLTHVLLTQGHRSGRWLVRGCSRPRPCGVGDRRGGAGSGGA